MVGITKRTMLLVSSQIKKGAVLSYAGVVFNAIAGLLYTPWMIDSIGASNYGLYTLAISVINFFLLDFGLGDAVSRFLSKYYAEGQEDLANSFLGIAYRIYFVVSAGIALILLLIFFFIDVIYNNLTVAELEVFRILYVVVSLYSVISFPFLSFNGILSANEKFVALNLCNLLQKVAIVAFIVVALLLGMGVYALVAANAAVSLSFVVVKFIIIKKTTNARPCFNKTSRGMAREVLSFSFWAMVVQLCQRFIFSIMPTILAAVSNSWEIALFGLASSLEGYVWAVANALNGMFMPRVSRILAGNEEGVTLQDLTVKLGRIQLYVVGGIVVVFSVIGSRFIDCWVGSDYSALYTCTLLLVVPSIIDLPLMIANTAIIAAGEVKARGIVYIFMSIANILLGIILASRYGSIGACASICVAYFIRTSGMCVLYKRKLGLRLCSFIAKTYPRWIVVSFFSFVVVGLFSAWLPFSGWLGFAAVSLLFVFVYACFCYMFAFNQYERNLIGSALARLKRKM